MSDLTPERWQDWRAFADGVNGAFVPRAVMAEVLAALDAERARADQAETGTAHQREMKLEWKARAELLEAVAEAARYVVEKAYNVAECGEHPDHLIDAEHAVRLLAAALAVLEEPPA